MVAISYHLRDTVAMAKLNTHLGQRVPQHQPTALTADYIDRRSPGAKRGRAATRLFAIDSGCDISTTYRRIWNVVRCYGSCGFKHPQHITRHPGCLRSAPPDPVDAIVHTAPPRVH